MNERNCENIRIAATARADGYQSGVSSEQIETHLANCADCREELDQMFALNLLLDKQSRQQQSADIWTLIAGRLPGPALAKSALLAWHPFMLLSLVLLGYKLVEMIPDREFGLLFKLAPIFLIVAAFGYLKENPFKINPDLRLEKEEVTG